MTYNTEIPTYVPIIAWPPIVTTGSTLQIFGDPNGDTWIAKNGVKGGNWYRATNVLHSEWYKAGAFTVGAIVNINMDTMVKDDYGLWNATTQGWVAPIPGWYDFTIGVAATATATGQWILNRPAKNGASYHYSMGSSAGTYLGAVCAFTTYLNAGDTMVPAVNASTNLTGAPGPGWTWGTCEYRGTG